MNLDSPGTIFAIMLIIVYFTFWEVLAITNKWKSGGVIAGISAPFYAFFIILDALSFVCYYLLPSIFKRYLIGKTLYSYPFVYQLQQQLCSVRVIESYNFKDYKKKKGGIILVNKVPYRIIYERGYLKISNDEDVFAGKQLNNREILFFGSYFLLQTRLDTVYQFITENISRDIIRRSPLSREQKPL